MSWPLAAYGLLGLALLAGFGWYERSRPDARIVALVGTLAAFAALGRIAFAAVPNVKPTTDIVLVAGFTLGAGPGFAVGAIAGLTSNFFFGQGPWTPWQMAAWGATGVIGALLARGRRGRPLRRVPLALACGIVGFGFTAVQDVGDWVTYSGHGLASLAAYVGTGLGFDAVHAAGCVAFALAFGPALARTVQRFAARVETRWLPAGSRVAPGMLAALALGAGGLLGLAGRPSPARAASGAVARTVGYLERAQNADGGLGAAPGTASAQLFAGWAALGLASAGVDVATLRRAPGEPSLLAFLARGAGARDPGSLERTILAVRAAGASATDVDGHDLVAALARRVSARGSVSGTVNLTAFAVLALRAAGGAGGPARTRAVRWLSGQADRDGGYGFAGRGGQSDADDTGAVLEALGGAGGARVMAARRRAVGFLRRDEDTDGGFPDGAGGPGSSSNAQSTAWAIQGLIAAGVAPGSVSRGGHTPLAYLQGLVSGSGAVAYARGQTQTPVWVSGEALMALDGRPLPVLPAAVHHRPATAVGRAVARMELSVSALPGAIIGALRVGRERP